MLLLLALLFDVVPTLGYPRARFSEGLYVGCFLVRLSFALSLPSTVDMVPNLCWVVSWWKSTGGFRGIVMLFPHWLRTSWSTLMFGSISTLLGDAMVTAFRSCELGEMM